MRCARRSTRNPATWLSISVCALSLCGCAGDGTLRDRQDAVIGAGSAYHPRGCDVRDLGDPEAAPVRWEGPTYVLPAETYKALMRSGGME